MNFRKERNNDQIRDIIIKKNIMENAYASLLIQCGKTKVLCTASVNEKTPPFIDETQMGWLTAEYNMLPGSTLTRKPRSTYKPDSRGIEIQRIIARSLRAAVHLNRMKGLTVLIDCDVIQADGGTRTTSINGGYIVLEMAIRRMLQEKRIKKDPIKNKIASISAGIVNKELLLDLDYSEDSKADADINVVMNDKGNFIEIQGTGENSDIPPDKLLKILEMCKSGIESIFEIQQRTISNNE